MIVSQGFYWFQFNLNLLSIRCSFWILLKYSRHFKAMNQKERISIHPQQYNYSCFKTHACWKNWRTQERHMLNKWHHTDPAPSIYRAWIHSRKLDIIPNHCTNWDTTRYNMTMFVIRYTFDTHSMFFKVFRRQRQVTHRLLAQPMAMHGPALRLKTRSQSDQPGPGFGVGLDSW